MDVSLLKVGRTGIEKVFKRLGVLLACAGPVFDMTGAAQERESLAGEQAAQALKAAVQAEAAQYNIRSGPVGFQVGGRLRVGYTDNVFYSETDRKGDLVIMPEVRLATFVQVSELNALRLAVGVGYEYYARNPALNGDAPLLSPDSELAFNLFVGDFRIRIHDKFSYQQTLFINTGVNGQDLLFNFNNVGIFSRWDNLAGFNVDWDLDRVIVSAGYDHENFSSSTASFEYLNRASELFTASVSFLLGDQVKIGPEAQAGLHNYERETTLNDHWRARVGPFVEAKLPQKITLRAGGGYDAAWYDTAGAGSDFETYYAYGRIAQETRLFTHALSAGRENLLGENANNLEDTYIRYSITSPVLKNTEVTASGSVHFDREYGGAFRENYTYYVVGLRAGYQFHKYWRGELGYEFILKDSDLPDRDFYRNRVTLGLAFTF